MAPEGARHLQVSHARTSRFMLWTIIGFPETRQTKQDRHGNRLAAFLKILKPTDSRNPVEICKNRQICSIVGCVAEFGPCVLRVILMI